MTAFLFFYSFFFTLGCFTIDKSDKKIDRSDLVTLFIMNIVSAAIMATLWHFVPPIEIVIQRT